MKSNSIITKDSKEFKLFEFDSKYQYNIELTKKLDEFNGDFNQNIVNEIVLWKVDRYVELDNVVLNLLNKIHKKSKFNLELTENILSELLSIDGIQIAMASTILRFKNPNIYQIIDQRAFRFVYGDEKLLSYCNNNKSEQIRLYIDYLNEISQISKMIGIEFSQIDRVLYTADKELNANLTLGNKLKKSANK